jgi:hypothetical protein
MNKLKVYATQDFFKKWAAVSLLAIAIIFLIDFFIGSDLLLYGIGIVALITIFIILRIVQLILKRLEERSSNYDQIEALFSLYHYLKPGVVLPKMRNHAGSPDFLKTIVAQLDRLQPEVIIEASSGISSIVISEWLLQNAPDSKHFALENEEKYANLTRSRIRNTNSQIVHAPLVSHDIKGKSWQWYTINEELSALESIDMIVVDGPPVHIQEHARFPAVPLLIEKLSDKGVVIMDDGGRSAEREIVQMWCEEYGLSKEWIPLEKGGYILMKKQIS